MNELHDLLLKTWNNDNEIVPSDWKKSLVSINCEEKQCNNLRQFKGCLPFTNCKQITRKNSRWQAYNSSGWKTKDLSKPGLRKAGGITEQIFILRNIIEQSLEWQASLYVNFVDFQKVFDSLARERIWQILRSNGIPEKFVCIISNWYDNSGSAVIYEGGISDWFKVTTGVKQGCVIWGFIFIIVIDWVWEDLWKNEMEYDGTSTLLSKMEYFATTSHYFQTLGLTCKGKHRD